MTYLKVTIYINLIVMLQFIACKAVKEHVHSPKDIPALVAFVNAKEASKLIVQDKDDMFLSKLSQLEKNIQMKTTNDKSHKEYLKFLSNNVADWSLEESLEVHETFSQIKAMLDTISPRIFPGGIKLIKIKTKPYGDNVYYTRDRIIYIPENIFPLKDKSTFRSTMIHEVFHIISRYNPDLRHEMYSWIGFFPANKQVKLNNFLSKRILTNPDAPSFQYVIKLKMKGGDEKLAVPLITSKFENFKTSISQFFDYLNFDLYELEDKGEYYLVKTNTNGSTTIHLQETPSFFEQIKDNTQYIIHPEEIMADNFMLAVEAFYKNEYSKFSQEGRLLINKIIQRLAEM